MVTRKKKKTLREFRDNKSRITNWGKKKNIIGRKNKEKVNFVTLVEKNQEICTQLVKRKKTLQNAAMLQLQKVLNTK